MNLSQNISVFTDLGVYLEQMSEEELQNLSQQARAGNGWFTEKEVRSALHGIRQFLYADKLARWVRPYNLPVRQPKNVGVVMAGNIPAVGFHDAMCVLIAGHRLLAKLSSQDQVIMRFLLEKLKAMGPWLSIYTPERLNEADAMIATGSDNSARYFEYYFKEKPNIIRKNRTSVAILSGGETPEQLKSLGMDIFSYYGLGCRNISKVYHPAGYDLTVLMDSMQEFVSVIDNHKYKNNYDYNKSVLLINGVKHLDSGHLLLRESTELVSPISVLFTEAYKSQADLNRKLELNKDKIQCIVGTDNSAAQRTEFGTAQTPEVWDYADGVDTLKFLEEL